MSSAPLLQVQQLQIIFSNTAPNKVAVSGIDFILNQGEVLGLVGESGSGKSVSALSLLRLLRSDQASQSGQALWTEENGQLTDLFQLPERDMIHYRGRQISMIFQEPMSSLNPIFSCGSQVSEVLQRHLALSAAEAKNLSLSWFEKVKLPDPLRMYQSYPHQLSGGQRQRVMIAMALCTAPRLLIADEPTTALDVTVQASILDLIHELKEESQAAILFISHDLGVIRQLAQRVLVMRHGVIVEQGETASVFARPEHPYTRGLIACRPPLHQAVSRLPVIEDFTAAQGTQTSPILSDRLISHSTVLARRAQLDAQAPLLEAQNIQVWYQQTRPWWSRESAPVVKAVDGLSFVIRPGESVGIVGESGSGKTSVGRSLVGLAKLHDGQILFRGQTIYDARGSGQPLSRPNIQMVFQDPFGSLNPAMTVGEMLMEPLQLAVRPLHKSEKQARVLEILQRVGLPPDSASRYPLAFSGGQRQRIGIARALISKPEILICDESVSALDVSVQAQILNLLKDLQSEQGFALLFISHDLSVINFISDHILVMHQGLLVESGPPELILQKPKHVYTQQLIAAIPA